MCRINEPPNINDLLTAEYDSFLSIDICAVVQEKIENVRPHEKEMIPDNVIQMVELEEEKKLTVFNKIEFERQDLRRLWLTLGAIELLDNASLSAVSKMLDIVIRCHRGE